MLKNALLLKSLTDLYFNEREEEEKESLLCSGAKIFPDSNNLIKPQCETSQISTAVSPNKH